MPARTSSAESPSTTPVPIRFLGLEFDRLSLRLALGVALLVILPLGIGLHVLVRRQYDQAIDARRRAAELQNRMLETALRHQMMAKDTTLMSTILGEIGTQPEVRQAMILNHEGEVRISSDPSRIGDRISRESPACMVCHTKEPEDRERWVLLDGQEGGTLRSVLPIQNHVACHQCHDAGARLNGILILDISLDEVQAAFRRDVGAIWAGAVVLALLVLSGVSLFVRHLVLRRLGRLRATAHSIAAGNLDERVAIGGRDVITGVASDVNRMADAVSELLGEIQTQEDRLANIVNSLDDGLVVLDGHSRIVACNRSFGRRLGRRPEEARGWTCRAAGVDRLPCCRSEGECPASLCASTGGVQRAVFRTEEDGSRPARVEEVYASPVLGPTGEVVQVVEIWRDITERVQEEERLAEIERLVSLGVLASGFSHEVNTPLATVLMCAESILGRLDGCDGPGALREELPAIREGAAIIRQQVLRCRKITEEFLRFARGIPPGIEPLDLRVQVDEVLSLVHPTAQESRVAIRVAERGPLPLVRANTEVVRHVMLSLLVNAIQSCEGRPGSVTVDFHVDGDVRIEMRDTGCGIPAADRRHLFEPFRSRKPQGTGLGLFLSRSFMRRFGGDVRLVESEVGRGSCFHVIFARALEAKP